MSMKSSLRSITGMTLLVLSAMSQAWGAACGGGPGVFNTFEGGKVAIDQGLNYQNSSGTCNISISGSTWANVVGSNLYGPLAQNSNEKKCDFTPTDQNVTKLTNLPAFPTTPTAPNIYIYNWNGPTSNFAMEYNGVTKEYRYCSKQGDTFWVTCDCGSNDCTKNKDAITTVGVVTLPKAGDSTSTFQLSGNEFGSLRLNGVPAVMTGTGDIKVDYLYLVNRAQITLQTGRNYFVRQLDLWDQFKLHVTGTGRANLYAWQVLRMNGNGSCVNINGNCTGDNDSVPLTAQNPERLGIYVYTGNLELFDRTQIAASIYVHNGDLKMWANSNFTFIGEAAAQNIAIRNNNLIRLHYQDTGSFTTIYPAFTAGKVGLYSAARPAVPQLATVGDYSFIAYQMDYSRRDNQKHYGTLRAYALQSDGKTATSAAWDANSLMTENDRRSKIYVDVKGTAVSVNALTSANLTTIDSTLSGVDLGATQNRIAQGPGGSLATWTGFLGKPNGTQPLIFKDRVFFSTSEGILYALDAKTGAFLWGWIPEGMVKGFTTNAAYEAQVQGDPMKGQISATTIGGVDYVMGTAKNGEIHYGLALDATTGLPTRVWYDVRTGKTSPNAEKPLVYLDKALYVVDDRVVVRPVIGGNPNTDPNNPPNVGGGTITSSPTIVQYGTDYTLYVGTSNGYVMDATLSSNGNVGNFSQTAYTGYNEAIRYVVYTKTVEYEYLTAQSKTRVTTFKRKVKTNDAWKRIWSTTTGSSLAWDFNTSATVTSSVPALPADGEITDRVTSLGGFIGIPVTLPPSGNSCDPEARLYLAPLDVKAYYSMYYLGNPFTDSYLTLGSGQALSAQGMYLDGRMIMQGHSEQNVNKTEGLDNPLEFIPVPPNNGPGRRGWREILMD